MRLLWVDFFLVTWNEIVLVPQLMCLSHISWYIFPCQLIAHELLSLGDFVPCKVKGRIFRKESSDCEYFFLTAVSYTIPKCMSDLVRWLHYFNASAPTGKGRTQLCLIQSLSAHRNESLVIQSPKCGCPALISETQSVRAFAKIKIKYD